MKVMLVQGYLGPMPENSLVYPLGLAYIATALDEAGHEVAVCDPNVHSDGLDQVRRALAEHAPDVVGISLRNIDTCDYLNYSYYYQHLEHTVRTIRQACPTARLMIGGAGFSTFPERIMRDHPDLDFGIVLDGEETAVDLLRNLARPADVPGLYYRDGDEVHFSGQRAFPTLANQRWPRRDFFDLAPYLEQARGIGIQSYRGCPLGCVYCGIPELNGRKLRCRSPQDVVDEIEHLYREYSVKDIAFTDSVFDLDRSFARAVCQELIERGLGVRWKAYFETWKFDESWFLLAQRAGCDGFFFSPDGATDATMRALGKRCREKDLENVLDIAARHPEATFHVALFCGIPGQNWRDVWKSVLLVARTHYLLKNSMCFLNWIRVLPNTEIYRQIEAAGTRYEEADLLPAQVPDHRRLFFIAPDSPRLATPIVLGVYRMMDRLRQRRKRVVTSAGQSR